MQGAQDGVWTCSALGLKYGNIIYTSTGDNHLLKGKSAGLANETCFYLILVHSDLTMLAYRINSCRSLMVYFPTGSFKHISKRVQS